MSFVFKIVKSSRVWDFLHRIQQSTKTTHSPFLAHPNVVVSSQSRAIAISTPFYCGFVPSEGFFFTPFVVWFSIEIQVRGEEGGGGGGGGEGGGSEQRGLLNFILLLWLMLWNLIRGWKSIPPLSFPPPTHLHHTHFLQFFSFFFSSSSSSCLQHQILAVCAPNKLETSSQPITRSCFSRFPQKKH